MLGRGFQNFFIKIYVLMILNLWFWGYTLIGLGVLGVGPALRTISESFFLHGWKYREYHMKESWQLYKQSFWRSTAHFWLFGAVFALLAWNLYLSTQMAFGWVAFIQFILIFAILLTVSTGLFTLAIVSRYEISFKLALKLALAQIFSNFGRLLVFVAGVGLIIAATVKWPGTGLFLSISGVVVWTHILSGKWYAKIDTQLEA